MRLDGTDALAFGRTLCTRWGCDPLTGDATWLHGDDAADLVASRTTRSGWADLRQVHAQAEQTPWSLSATPTRDPGRLDPRIRLLMAEVQSRCGGEFVEADASDCEERLTRENARLRIETAKLRDENAGRDRLITALAESDPTERPEVWAQERGSPGAMPPGSPQRGGLGLTQPPPPSRPTSPEPTEILDPRLRSCRSDHPINRPRKFSSGRSTPGPRRRPHWSRGRWAQLVASRARLSRKFDLAVGAIRRRVAGEASERRKAKLAVLSEFAGGAGHELNNPLAVILGAPSFFLPALTIPNQVVHSERHPPVNEPTGSYAI